MWSRDMVHILQDSAYVFSPSPFLNSMMHSAERMFFTNRTVHEETYQDLVEEKGITNPAWKYAYNIWDRMSAEEIIAIREQLKAA